MPAASRSNLIAASVVGLLTVALGGCAASDAAPVSTPTPTVSLALEMDAATVSGTGPTEPFPGIDFPIPDGARSVTIDFECSGGMNFHIELGDPMAVGEASLGGACDGTKALVWPITEETAQTLYVWTVDGVEWTATPHFSTEEFVRDDAITAECEAFSTIYSALMNADQGLTTYKAFDEAEWKTRIDAAAAELESLVNSSETTMADAFTQVLAAARGEGAVPGFMLSGTGLIDPIGETCNTNHSQLILMAEFGG